MPNRYQIERITPAQRVLLEAARDHGNPWRIGGVCQPWSASRQASIDRLASRGLLCHERGKGHGAPTITLAGRQALDGSAGA